MRARSDIEVELICLNEGELTRRLRASDIRVTVVPEQDCAFPKLVRRVRVAVQGADLVHAHRYKENLLASLSGRPWIATQHGRPEAQVRLVDALRLRAYNALSFCAMRYSARSIIAVSHEVETWLAARLGDRNIHCIHNGLFDPVDSIGFLPWVERPLVLGVVGRLVPVKGIDLAIKLLVDLPDVQLEIIGDGPLRRPLEELAQHLSVVQRIRFLGYLENPLPRIAQWRALLVTSLHEGNPMAVIEALAVGTPIVSSMISGVTETLDGRGGWTVGSRDPSAWAAEIRRIFLNPSSAALTSSAARCRYLEEFTASMVAQRTTDVYRELG